MDAQLKRNRWLCTWWGS